MLTGSFPVHDAPPISCFAVGFLGASPRIASGSTDFEELSPVGCLLGFGSLSEFVKMMKLLSSVPVAGEGFFPPPAPGLAPFDCPFLTIFGQSNVQGLSIHEESKCVCEKPTSQTLFWGKQLFLRGAAQDVHDTT